MVSIHDSVARIYEQTGHADWAARERAARRVCRPPVRRSAKRCASFAPDAIVRRSRPRWPERIWNRATGARAPRPSSRSRPSSGSTGCPTRASAREMRATRARAERRYTDAVAELKAALAFAPGDPALLDDLGTTYYAAREYDAGGRHPVAARQGQPRRPAAADGLRRLAAAAAAARRGAARASSAPSSANRPTRRRGLRSAARTFRREISPRRFR